MAERLSGSSGMGASVSTPTISHGRSCLPALGPVGPGLFSGQPGELMPRAETRLVSPQAMHEATMEVSKEGKMDTSKDMDSRNTIACHTYTATPLVVKFNRPFFLFVVC